MHNYVKASLVVGGGLLALKIWNDSKALETAIKEKNNTKPVTSASVGGHLLPPPVSEGPPLAGSTVSNYVMTPNESGLGAANPDVSYRDAYMGVG